MAYHNEYIFYTDVAMGNITKVHITKAGQKEYVSFSSKVEYYKLKHTWALASSFQALIHILELNERDPHF